MARLSSPCRHWQSGQLAWGDSVPAESQASTALRHGLGLMGPSRTLAIDNPKNAVITLTFSLTDCMACPNPSQGDG